TPHLDKFVAGGFTFTHAFCMGSTQPAVCVPSRAMLLSGRSLFRVDTQLPKDTPLWPEVFRKAGYVTHGIGKWHNGPASYARCFDGGDAIFFGGMGPHEALNVHPFDPSGRYAKDHAKLSKTFSSELFADAAIQFLKGHNGDRPFALYVAFTAPHDPRTP